MSHNQNGMDETSSTFSVIFKVNGETIQLGPKERTQIIGEKYNYKISCHNVEARTDPHSNLEDIQGFTFNNPAPLEDFRKSDNPRSVERIIGSTDLAMFMTAPMASTRKAAFVFRIGIVPRDTINANTADSNAVSRERVGAAYVYLDPKFSSQGTQRTPIIANHNHAPLGQLEIEYLIINKPVAYGKLSAQLSWIDKRGPLHCGHRGSGSGRRLDLEKEVLENTINSFNYAHRNGADVCELDVLVSADGVPIVYHDFYFDAVIRDTTKDQLSKFRVPVSQFTVKQLKEFCLLSKREGRPYTFLINSLPPQSTPLTSEEDLDELRVLRDSAIIKGADCKSDATDVDTLDSQKPFPTLEEVLRGVDPECALNIELKWPQALASGKNEANQYREINDHVDRILRCIDEHHNGRRIFLSTFNVNIALMLRLKQAKFPVLFLTTGNKDRFRDPITKSVLNAAHFALAFDLAGINPNVEYLDEELVHYARDRGLLVYAWGKIETTEAIRDWRRTGLNGIIYDKIDLIKPQD